MRDQAAEIRQAMEGTAVGMTLRDYLAGQALANMAHAVGAEQSAETVERIFRMRAKQCYQMADAMLAARETK